MRTSHKVLLGLNLALVLGGCADSTRVSLPPDNIIVDKKAKASIHPTENYVLGQVQVRVTKDEELSSVLDNMKVQYGIELSALDLIPNQSTYLLEINSLHPVDSVIKSLK